MRPPEPGTAGGRLAVLIGATASGKSHAAVIIAERFSGEVINADSRLFYRGMEIGTARPPGEMLSKAPHHLISFLKPDQPYNLAQYLQDASQVITDVQSRGNLPVLVGGTGQYVWGLLEGWQVPEIPPDDALRQQLERELEEYGVDALYARLRELDADIAADIDRKNPRRVIRALERVSAGVRFRHRTAINPEYDSIIIGLHVERAELHRRIAERVDHMLAEGWIEEVRALIDSGISFDSPALSAIGRWRRHSPGRSPSRRRGNVQFGPRTGLCVTRTTGSSRLTCASGGSMSQMATLNG